MAVTGDTQLAPTKAEIISEIAQRRLVDSSAYAATMSNWSAFAKKGAKEVSVPKLTNEFSVENRATATQATIQDLDFNKDTIILNQRATISWLVDPMDEIESSLEVERILVEQAADDHALYFDDQVVLEAEAAGVATATAGDISEDIVLEMREALLRRNGRLGNIFLVLPPEQETFLLKEPRFTEPDRYGSAQIPNGAIGRIHGVMVVLSNRNAAQQYFMYDRSALAFALQKGPSLDERKAPEYGTGAMLKVMDQKFGVKGMHIGLKGVGAAESALIVKDGNI